MKLVWDSSFRKAYKRWTRNQPRLQDRIFQVLEKLEIAGSSLHLQSILKLAKKSLPYLISEHTMKCIRNATNAGLLVTRSR